MTTAVPGPAGTRVHAGRVWVRGVATALVAALVGLAGVVPYPSGSSRVAAWSVHVTAPQEGRGPSPVSLERYVTDLVGRIMIKGIA